MPTEELKFEDLIKEYIDVVESIDISKLEEDNKIMKVDVERKGREEKNIDGRIDQIQEGLDYYTKGPAVLRLEYRDVIIDRESKLKEAKDYKEKKQEEIQKLENKIKENIEQIEKANNIGEEVIKRAEEKTNKEQEEIEKKIAELEERKAKYGVKRIDKDGNEKIQLTKEEQIVVDSIDKDIKKLNKEIRDNKKAFLLFKKTIEDAKKDKEAFLDLKNKVKGKEEPQKEEPKEKPEQEKNNEQKTENAKEEPKKDDITHEEIPVEPTGKTTEKTGNNNPTPKPTGKTEKKLNEEGPKKEPVKQKKENTKPNKEPVKPKEINEIEEDNLVKEELEYKPVPGAAKPEEELHEVKAEEDKDIYSSSYGKNLQEYKDMLSMYKDAFLTLGDLQQQYENGEIPYSAYEKQALYVADRYKFMMGEYAKIKDLYDKEKLPQDEFAGLSNEELENKLKELDEEGNELWQQGVHENTPDAKRYHELLAEIKKIKEELQQRKENPLRGMSLEELEEKRNELYAKIAQQQEPDEYEFRTHKENGLEGYEEDEIDKGLREIRKEIERRQPKNIEAPEEPVKAGMILEKVSYKEPEINYDAIEEEYAYRKQDMVDKFMGNHEKAKEYEKRLNRFKDHIIEKEFEYVDENGRTCKGTYKTIEGYEEYAKDAFFLQLEEYKDRLEDMTKFDAGDKSIYKDIKIGDRVITAQEQRDKDNEYVKTYNNAYNSHVHTQKNLMTLGNYGDKLPYSKFEKKQPIRNILRATGNALKFARNWTIAPVSRFVGKRIVAPIHKAIYKPDQSNPNPYKGRLTHRYEQRKNYFREQGKGYFRSSIAAMFKYKEGNRGTLAARGGEIFQSIENKHIQKAQKEAEAKSITNKIQNTKEKIDRVKEKLQNTNDGKEKAELDKELSGLIQAQTDLQRERYDVLSRRVSQTVQTDSIDNKTHDRANKRTITRAVTTVKALAIGATRYFGPKLHKRIIEGTREEVVTWKKGPDTVVNSKQYVEGNYQDITLRDYMAGKANGSYAAGDVGPHELGFNANYIRSAAYKNGSIGDGWSSVVDGKGMTTAEIARYADEVLPKEMLDAAGNLNPDLKMSELAEFFGEEINSSADYYKFVNNLNLGFSRSSTGIPTAWVGKLNDRLGIEITDGHWATIATTVPGKMQKVIEYADNETVKNILDMIRKGTDKVIIADVIDQVYQNVRETEGKGKNFNPNRDYGFSDKGKTKGPDGFDYDRKGRNKNTGKKFVPTYSSLAMSVLSAKSVDEIKEKLSGIKISELTDEEKSAISGRMEELHTKEKSNSEQHKLDKIKAKLPRLSRNKRDIAVISKAKTMATSLGRKTIGGLKIAGNKLYGRIKGKNLLTKEITE